MRRDIAGGHGLALVVLVSVLLSSGLAVARIDSAGPAGDFEEVSRWNTVWIHVTQEVLALTEEVALPPDGWVPVPKGLQGRLEFDVTSPLPEWAIAVRFECVPGECGVMDEACMMVAAGGTGGEFVPVCDRPVVINGTGPAPATGLWLELQARPEWTHAPGVYEGFLHLIPLADEIQLVSEVPLPNGRVGVPLGEDGQPISEVPGPDGRVGFPSGRKLVPVTMTVEPLTVIMTSETEFHIEAPGPPGRVLRGAGP